MSQPVVNVGIMSVEELKFSFSGEYNTGYETVTADQTARAVDGKVEWNGNLYDELIFVPKDAANHFTLRDVSISTGNVLKTSNLQVLYV